MLRGYFGQQTVGCKYFDKVNSHRRDKVEMFVSVNIFIVTGQISTLINKEATIYSMFVTSQNYI